MKFSLIRNETLTPLQYKAAVKRALGQAMEWAEQEAKRLSPSRQAAGSFGGRGGIVFYIQSTKEGTYIGVLSGTARDRETGFNYLQVLERGSGLFSLDSEPRRITPRHARVLAWLKDGRPNPTTPAGWNAERERGNAVFVKSTSGTHPRLFMQEAMERSAEKLPKFLQAEIMRVS